MGATEGAVADRSQADGAEGGTETVMTATELDDRFGELMDRAFAGERFQVTRYGKARMYCVGPKDYERLRELERAAENAK